MSVSTLTADFRLERSVNGTVTLAIKTVPAKRGDWGLFAILAVGLFSTALLGSSNEDIRANATPTLVAFLGFLAIVGVAFKFLVVWAARKTSGSLCFSPSTRTLSHKGLAALFPWRECVLPEDAVLVLDAVRVLEIREERRLSVFVRLWYVRAQGTSPAQMAQLIEAHRQHLSRTTVGSVTDALLPDGASVLGTAFENPIFRRLAGVLVESGKCAAYDATGAQTEKFTTAPRKTAVIGAPQRFVIRPASLPIRILFTVMGIVAAGFIGLVSLNPYVAVYIFLLILLAVSKRQVVICDESGLSVRVSYLMGLWRRDFGQRRWEEVTAVQLERAPNGFTWLAIRRVDGDDWKVAVPNERAGRKIEQEIKRQMGVPALSP